MSTSGLSDSLSSSTSTLLGDSYHGNATPSPFAFATAPSDAPRHASTSAPSHVSKTYRQASALFLTRRLPEALTTLAPLINPPPRKQQQQQQQQYQQQQQQQQQRRDGQPDADSESDEPAPVATTTRNIRIKVWTLYLTILNAVLDMDPDEGKDTFGTHEWRVLCNKVKDGGVWEEVVKHGFHGVEGNVDSDVVINLATLLLAHAKNQHMTQKRLEAYLAASSDGPSLDLSHHPVSHPDQRSQSPSPPTSSRLHKRRQSGANTPRDLNARVKVLELFTLHVLPRNDEWEYAREFIDASAVLDDERREAFMQALQSLQEHHAEDQAARDREDAARREEIARKEKELEDARQARELDATRQKREEADANRDRAREHGSRARNSSSSGGSGGATSSSDEGSSGSTRGSRYSRPASSRTAAARKRDSGFGARAGRVVTGLLAVIEHAGASLLGNPAALTRLLAFVVGIVLTLSNQTIRERLRRMLALAWAKLRATAGMGVKVSYM